MRSVKEKMEDRMEANVKRLERLGKLLTVAVAVLGVSIVFLLVLTFA